MRKRGKDETIEARLCNNLSDFLCVKNLTTKARCVTYLMRDIEITYNKFEKIQYTPTTVTTINRPERTEWLSQYIGKS